MEKRRRICRGWTKSALVAAALLVALAVAVGLVLWGAGRFRGDSVGVTAMGKSDGA